MLSWSIATVLVATPPTGFTLSVERFAVKPVASQTALTVEPLLGRLTLTGLALQGRAPALCSHHEAIDGGFQLHCKSRRLWAELVQHGKETYVDVRELTGISWLDPASQVPLRAWPLRSLALPDTCPGTLPAARGECALETGDLHRAQLAWTDCLNSPDMSLCRLRLGDLAWRNGDIEEALSQWNRVTPVGPVGRMVTVRKCELLGTCLKDTESLKVADTDLLPPVMAQELIFHTVRRELFAGRDAHALQVFVEALKKDPGLCLGASDLCQQFVAAGLASNDVDARIAALSTFLHDGIRHGSRGAQLNQLASQTATELGAYAFAAATLAANTPQVSPAKLPAHLREVIRLYLSANDPVRAAVVMEYAESKLGALTRASNWASLRAQLKKMPTRDVVQARPAETVASLGPVQDAVYVSTDLARAAAALSRATTQVRTAVENAP